MTTWVLILVLWKGSHSVAVEFNTEETCNVALSAFVKHTEQLVLFAGCFKK
jgi:hypothetical protein